MAYGTHSTTHSSPCDFVHVFHCLLQLQMLHTRNTPMFGYKQLVKDEEEEEETRDAQSDGTFVFVHVKYSARPALIGC